MFDWVLGPFREFGWFGGLIYSIDRVLGKISPRLRLYYHYWMVQPISEKRMLPEKYVDQMSVRLLEADDPLLDLTPIRPEIRRSRYAQGAICVGLFIKEEFAGFIWFTYDKYEEDEARCTFVLKPEGQAVFDFDLFLLPEYRGGIAFMALWDLSSKFLNEQGIRYSYSRLTAYKLRSAKSHAHFGWKRIGTAVVLRLWSLEVIFASQRPYVYVSIRDSARLAVPLRPDALTDAAK